MKVELFQQESTTTPLDADAINKWGKAINVALNIKVNPPGLAEVKVSDTDISINFSGNAFQAVAENGVISYYLVAKRTGFPA